MAFCVLISFLTSVVRAKSPRKNNLLSQHYFLYIQNPLFEIRISRNQHAILNQTASKNNLSPPSFTIHDAE